MWSPPPPRLLRLQDNGEDGGGWFHCSSCCNLFEKAHRLNVTLVTECFKLTEMADRPRLMELCFKNDLRPKYPLNNNKVLSFLQNVLLAHKCIATSVFRLQLT